jgi:YfiH family protein
VKPITQNGLPLLQFPHLAKHEGLFHAVTTREGGVSTGPFTSLNLGLNTGDVSQHVLRNRRKVLSALGWKSESLISPIQIHGKSVVTVTQNLSGRGTGDSDLGLGGADGLVTREKGLMLMIKVADCFPVILYDPLEKAIGLIHAGWRGAASGIITEGIAAMVASFGCKPENIEAGIGPGIGACCFVVGEDVREAFKQQNLGDDVLQTDEGKRLHCDLKKIISRELLTGGLKKGSIGIAAACTCCNGGLFYSHRREKGKTGRMAALIGLKG